MGLDEFFLARIGSGHFLLLGLGWVSHFLVWKFSANINFFPADQNKSLMLMSKNTCVKDRSTPYLLWFRCMLGVSSGPIFKFSSQMVERILAHGCELRSKVVGSIPGRLCQQFFHPRLQKNQQGTLSKGIGNLQPCGYLRLLWQGSCKGVNCTLTSAESMLHEIIIFTSLSLSSRAADPPSYSWTVSGPI